jgi:hypothetical protein
VRAVSLFLEGPGPQLRSAENATLGGEPLRARDLARDLLVLALGVAGLAEIAKFATFLDGYVLFPFWPDVLDLAVLALNVGGFLGLYVGVRKARSK